MISAPVIILTILFFAVYLYKNAHRKPVENFPPGPPSLPVYGAFFIVVAYGYRNLAASMIRLGQKYKTKVVGMYLGAFPTVVVNDPDLVKEMLNRPEFDGRNDIILARLRSYWKKLGIFFTDGFFWMAQRRFAFRYLRDYGFGRRCENLENVVESEMKVLLDITADPKSPAEKKVVNGDLVYLYEYFSTPATNAVLYVLARLTLPRSEYSTLWELSRHAMIFQRGSDDLGGALSLTPWLKDLFPNMSGFNGLMKGNQYLLKFYEDLIKKAMETHNESYDRHFLDMYIKKMKEEIREGKRSTFSVEQLAMICVDFTFPPASAIPMVLTILTERLLLQPEIQDKIHEEIDRVVGKSRLPNLDDRKNMPYLESCIREIMRYDTLVPLGVAHRAMENTQIGGYNVPENTIVSANYVPLHMNKEIWGDPENFRPERFIRNGRVDPSLDKSLPFGAGRRLCAGETFARQTLFQMFSMFMQAYRVSTVDGKPLKKPAKRIQGIITTIPEFWIRITPRT
uniref:Cytochrome P450 CYP304F2 n=1 Tax=Zygaena filipendulae TaxID=287375 RepID=D2JLK2_9NEOP|nr:cytochrome P450 CYP304F2 [Zygaena filipendulae]